MKISGKDDIKGRPFTGVTWQAELWSTQIPAEEVQPVVSKGTVNCWTLWLREPEQKEEKGFLKSQAHDNTREKIQKYFILVN